MPFVVIIPAPKGGVASLFNVDQTIGMALREIRGKKWPEFSMKNLVKAVENELRKRNIKYYKATFSYPLSEKELTNFVGEIVEGPLRDVYGVPAPISEIMKFVYTFHVPDTEEDPPEETEDKANKTDWIDIALKLLMKK